jgi:hypothetical protein
VVIRRLASIFLVLAAACAREPAGGGEAAPARAVPGLETAVVSTERVRDVLRVPGLVAPDGLTPEARDARTELTTAEARLRLAIQQTARLRALAPGDVSPKKELEAALAEEASARAAAEHARQIAATLGGTAETGAVDGGGAWLVARVPQEAVGLVVAGAPARFTPDAGDRSSFAAAVAAPPSYVDAASRTAPVRVRATDPERRLLPGMTGSLAIEVGDPHDGVVAPEAAVVYDAERALVFVDDGHGGYTETPVTVGVVRDGRAEIVTGLAPGARVATTGAASLLSAARLGAGAAD